VSALLITHRRMQKSPGGSHEHVGWVRLKDGRTLSRGEVFAKMRLGIAFKTHSPFGHEAKVIHVRCRICSHDYLRTDRDRLKDDNLDALPKF
jgi:Protein of unknown function (DUF3892)